MKCNNCPQKAVIQMRQHKLALCKSHYPAWVVEQTDRFIQKYIWPGGYIPARSEIVAASEPARLIMADCEALRLHYPPTVLHWYERFKACREEVIRRYDERFYRLWLFYLAAGLSMFSDGGMTVYQLQYLKRRDSTPITRDYMFEEEKRLRALDPAEPPMLIAVGIGE